MYSRKYYTNRIFGKFCVCRNLEVKQLHTSIYNVFIWALVEPTKPEGVSVFSLIALPPFLVSSTTFVGEGVGGVVGDKGAVV